jgi:hypothetical protein
MALTQQIGAVYQHVQSTPASSWTVVHGLNAYPVIDVFITYGGTLQKILPLGISYDTPNQCTVAFSTPLAGYATVA